MGDRPAPRRRIHRRQGRARARRARFSPSATRSSRSSRFRTRRPKQFARDAAAFRSAPIGTAGSILSLREFKHSFRSGESVLGAVDEVFKAQAIAASVTADADGFPPHIALPDAPPSVVEIWEPMKPDERKRDRRLGRAVRHRERDEPAGEARAAHRARGAPPGRRAARRSASTDAPRATATCSFWCASAGRCSRRSSARSRTRMLEVAGADRLVLTEHIAVMDLMALADALLLPAGRSRARGRAAQPAVRLRRRGLVRDRLRIAAAPRCVRRSSARRPSARLFAEAAARLDGLREAAQRQTPFAFYAALLGAGGGRRRFLARLGAGSQRRARRIPQSRARLRAARNAVAAGLRRLAARGARRGQARHGDRARRSARDDRARRQGPRSADRHSRRHDDAAGRAAAAAAPGASRRRQWSGPGARTTTCRRSPPRARRRWRKRKTNIAGSFMSR